MQYLIYIFAPLLGLTPINSTPILLEQVQAPSGYEHIVEVGGTYSHSIYGGDYQNHIIIPNSGVTFREPGVVDVAVDLEIDGTAYGSLALLIERMDGSPVAPTPQYYHQAYFGRKQTLRWTSRINVETNDALRFRLAWSNISPLLPSKPEVSGFTVTVGLTQ